MLHEPENPLRPVETDREPQRNRAVLCFFMSLEMHYLTRRAVWHTLRDFCTKSAEERSNFRSGAPVFRPMGIQREIRLREKIRKHLGIYPYIIKGAA